jgi:hypothetical protein
MLCVVSPVLQVLPEVALDVKVTLPPVQKLSGPLAVITGLSGALTTATETAWEVEEQPLLVTVTV